MTTATCTLNATHGCSMAYRACFLCRGLVTPDHLCHWPPDYHSNRYVSLLIYIAFLSHKYLSNISDDKQTFINCIDTIIRQVSSIHRMVNDFSTFTKMPRPIFEKIFINIRNKILEDESNQFESFKNFLKSSKKIKASYRRQGIRDGPTDPWCTTTQG